MARNNRKLTKLLINPDFQLKFVLLFLIFGFVLSFVYYCVLNLSFYEIMSAIESKDSLDISSLQRIVLRQKSNVILFSGLYLLASFLIFIFVGLRYTHNVAGSLHRLKSEFMEMKKNKKLHHVKLRKKDFFRDLENSFNQLVDELDSDKKN